MKFSTIRNKILILLVFVATFITGYSDDIKVGMECGYAPFNWFQNDAKNGAVKVDGGYCGGYDVEIAKVIAKKLNKNLVIVKTKWEALLGPALTSGKVDLVIAGMSATPERRQSLTFSKPYYESDLVVVVKKNGKYANAKSINDFVGAKITGQLNTLHYDVIDQMKGVQKQTAMESFPAMIVALNSGKIDGYISERPGAMAAQFSNPNLKFISFDKNTGFKYDTEEVNVAIGMKLGNTELEEKINKILDEDLTPKVRQRIMEKSIQNQPNEASRSFFGWVIFFIKNNWMTFVKGTLSTLYISITGTVVGFFIGLLVALLRYSEAEIDGQSHKYKKTGLKFLNWLSSIYIAVFRGTPMIVQSMVIYYGLSQVFHINLSPMVAALFIVSINTGAYMSEIIRGGIDSIDNGQFEAAKAIGMTNFQLMQSIIFPQMFRNILPMIGNELIVNIKDTSVLNVISVTELFFISNSVAGTYSRYYEVFIITSVIYFFLTFTLSLILKQIEKRIDGPQHFEILDDANGEEK